MKSCWISGWKRGLLAAMCAVSMLSFGCVLLPCLDQTDLIQEATDRAQEIVPGTIIFQVSGVNGCGCSLFGSKTDSYTFLAVEPDDAGVTHELSYDGTNWTTGTHPFPLLGVGYYDLSQITMTECQARVILRHAGHEDDFLGWSLYRPLHPSSCEATYIFNYGTKMVLINTQTQAVTVKTVSDQVPLLTFNPGEDSVSLAMIAAADAHIKETARSAFIIWSAGRDADGNPLQNASDTNVWDFIAVALDDTSVTAWRLSYDGEWQMALLAYPPFGIEYLDLNVVLGMDVVAAWSHAAGAGYDPPFDSWEVFKPLNPSVENPVYVFPIGSGFIVVDAVTGEVSHEGNCCMTDACYGHCSG